MSNLTSTSPHQKLLIIDDDSTVHALIKARLLGERIDIFTAGDGVNGFDLAIRLQPDLILLDVEMPAPDGLEVLRRLKEDPATWGIQIILMSTAADSDQRARGLDLGAVDYISKPCDASELRARVRATLRTKALLDLLATRSMIDGLTGLWNRSYMERRLESEVARAVRNNSPMSVIMIDVDRFKSINDQFGHPFGDQVLMQVAAVLTAGCRAEDAACRYGGEEFAILATGAATVDAVALAERLRLEVEQLRFDTAVSKLTVTCSFGVATVEPGVSVPLVERADRALYAAKRAGRNRIVVDAVAASTLVSSPGTPGER